MFKLILFIIIKMFSLLKYNKYKINYIYNTTTYHFITSEIFFTFDNHVFFNFKKNNKLVRKLIFLIVINFFFLNNSLYTRVFLPEFFNFNSDYLNIVFHKSVNFFYSLN